jgi:hypothetical protein
MGRILAALIAVAAGVVAVVVAPPTPALSMANDPWPQAAVRAASLGRTDAAADIAWVKTVQLMGSDRFAADGYPHLEGWVDLVTALEPRFDIAYFFGAILLVTDEKRAAAVDDLLARGEAALPDSFDMPMARGFVAYFGRQDPGAAADHYARAAKLPRAPKYLMQFAEHLRQQSADCRAMQNDLHALASQGTKDVAQAMAAERFAILHECVSSLIKRVDGNYKLAHGGKGLTVQQYVEQGLIDRELIAVTQTPELCWSLDSSKPSLRPCKSK